MPFVPDFVPFQGVHCETMATGNLLQHAGFPLSEPMMLGLGQGIGFGIFTIKSMPAPFVAGRARPEDVTRRLAQNLGLEVSFCQTRSRKKAWDNIARFIDAGQPVAAKLNCHFLDYFTSDIHFAGHYVAVHGYDETQMHVIDTQQQGGALVTSRARFEEGRLWKGPMASNAMTWTLAAPKGSVDWPQVLRRAIVANASSYNAPPIKNFGASGIRKAAALAPQWKDTVADAPAQLAQMGMLMERAGTGGGLFRKMYADFLREAQVHLPSEQLAKAEVLIRQAADGWRDVALGLERFAQDASVLEQVAERMYQIADLEEAAFKGLAALGTDSA